MQEQRKLSVPIVRAHGMEVGALDNYKEAWYAACCAFDMKIWFETILDL